jgi:hypothetical protein
MGEETFVSHLIYAKTNSGLTQVYVNMLVMINRVDLLRGLPMKIASIFRDEPLKRTFSINQF